MDTYTCETHGEWLNKFSHPTTHFLFWSQRKMCSKKGELLSPSPTASFQEPSGRLRLFQKLLCSACRGSEDDTGLHRSWLPFPAKGRDLTTSDTGTWYQNTSYSTITSNDSCLYLVWHALCEGISQLLISLVRSHGNIVLIRCCVASWKC